MVRKKSMWKEKDLIFVGENCKSQVHKSWQVIKWWVVYHSTRICKNY